MSTSRRSSTTSSSSSSHSGSHTAPKVFNYKATHVQDQAVAKGGVACPFPWRLHEMLKIATAKGLEDVVSWAPHGRAFVVHQPKKFADGIMKRFFSQTKYPSFQRQLNLYGFSRFCHGPDKGAYYHACFVRGQRPLVTHMIRRKLKEGRPHKPSPEEEPNFYRLASRLAQGLETAVPLLAPPSLARVVVSQVPSSFGNLPGAAVSESEGSFSSSCPDDSHHGGVAFFEGIPFHMLDVSAEPLALVAPTRTTILPADEVAHPLPVLSSGGEARPPPVLSESSPTSIRGRDGAFTYVYQL